MMAMKVMRKKRRPRKYRMRKDRLRVLFAPFVKRFSKSSSSSPSASTQCLASSARHIDLVDVHSQKLPSMEELRATFSRKTLSIAPVVIIASKTNYFLCAYLRSLNAYNGSFYSWKFSFSKSQLRSISTQDPAWTRGPMRP
ncbi:hypothetical protein FNV43_RR27287 [Rhamnella rubrinervis]|uniref:Uncharacterized protein n=1 Tax=Rhamnella rubrinervis TaxID=2594499 RepID=A0A8K0DWM0_9ROSA|nr:hypothetical protein FNV43_RR27287 [Rhamnella rubrinervis]